jgi:hypothetical protein
MAQRRRRPTKKRLAASRRQRAWLRRMPAATRQAYERERARLARQCWRIEVVYRGGYDWRKDKRIQSVVKRRCSGSGYYLPKRERDIDFHFAQRPAALRAVARLRRMRSLWKVTLFMREADYSWVRCKKLLRAVSRCPRTRRCPKQ